MLNKFKIQKGEIVLVILLIMAVGLTIGLSVAGRSLTDIRLSTQIEESGRAFSAAEAGIEEVLRQGLVKAPESLSGEFDDKTRYNVSLSPLGGSSDQFSFPNVISEGDSQTVWLIPHGEQGPDLTADDYNKGTISVCWKKTDASSTVVPALEMSVFFQEKPSAEDEYKVARVAYDPKNSGRENNGFETGVTVTTPSTSCPGYDYEVNLDFGSMDIPIDIPDILIALRLRPVYAGCYLAVKPPSGGQLPPQGKNIISTGQTASGVARRWNVVQTFAAPQDIFDYALWSGKELKKE